MVGLVVTSLVTSILSQGWRRVVIVGLICAGVSLCLNTKEITIVVQVVKIESSEFMSFTTPLWLTLSSMMWFIFFHIVGDKRIWFCTRVKCCTNATNLILELGTMSGGSLSIIDG
ncbi:hypothetical protein CTI12_AA325420 [Artemisia annua]|uniref:Uncharacterized protein n=1 Tax=Artemisia annua TaxID=35608 RepID=A0A2U1N0P4_ARTAN|nr:hypothetical protein CTI12_AA325420 [Artemisia annua]